METSPSDDIDRFSSDIPVETEGFSEEEREEILGQIEQVASRNRISLASEREELRPRKRGAFFPIAVNILAALCIAAGVYTAYRYFEQQEAKLDSEAESYLTAEGKIIEEVRRESRQRLQEKEEEISDIRQELQAIEEEQQNLEATMEQRIEEREQELREQMQQELARRRQSLEEQGLDTEQVQERLDTFRTERNAELEEQLQEFRRQSREELTRKQEELEEARETAQRILEEAQQEREELSRQAEERVEELRTEFSEERQRLEEESTEVSRELSRLSQLREREQLMLDQMSAMYRDIQDAIEAGNPDRAQSVIEDFRQLLRSPGIEELPAIAKRRDVELFLLTILEDSLRGAREQEAGESSLLDTARLVRDVRAAVERAREAEQQGNSYDAARYYTRAIETITAVQNAHESMLEIAADRRRSTADERSTLAQEELSAGNTDEGLEMLVTAAAEAAGRTGETVRSIIDTITGELRGELASLRARRAELESEIASLEEELASLEDQNSTLEENLDTARSSRSELQDELRSLEQQNSSLNERIGELEQEQAELQREYRRARGRVATLENDLEEAVDELAEFVSLTEDDRAPTERGTSESRAAEEYRRLVERSRDFTGGSAAEREAAREAFRSFLRSEEVRELFPRLPSIFQRLYGE